MSVHNFDKKLQQGIVDVSKDPIGLVASIIGAVLVFCWWIICGIGAILSAAIGVVVFVAAFVLGFFWEMLCGALNNIVLSGFIVLIGYGVYHFFLK